MDENYKILSQAQAKRKREPLIPLGSRGKLTDILWEVIGYMTRKDVASNYSWEEYLLFNPYQGYRWLTQAQGHWNLVVMTKERPKPRNWARQSVVYHDDTYYLFYRGHAEVTCVLGEFYWRTKVGDRVEMYDYVDPPILLSCEKDSSEQVWSWSEYIEPGVVEAAFNIKKPLPPRSGVAPNQPSPASQQLPSILLIWGIVGAIILVIQFLNIVGAKNEQVLNENYSYIGSRYATPYDPAPENPKSQSFSSPVFQLKHGLSNVEVKTAANISQSWLFLDGMLVNDDTGESYPFSPTLEYYSGSDGGESWSEGSYQYKKLFSSVPDGNYHVDIDAQGPTPTEAGGYVSLLPQVDFSVSVTRKVVNWGNFWWCIILVSLFPVIAWIRSYTFEVSRWSESDYSPYATEEE